MVNWIIVALVIVLAFVVFKFKEMRHRFGLITIIVILLLATFSFSVVSSKNNVDLSTFDGLVTAGKIYFSWIGGAFSNLKSISGFAVKQDWSANSTKTDN